MNRTAEPASSAIDTSLTKSEHATDAAFVINGSRQRLLLLALVFLCGAVSIGTELAMSRLLAPYFGTSTFIWANLIGLTLAFLAAGYYLGGRLADRYPALDVMLVIAGLAGFSVALIPVIARPILRLSLDAFDELNVGVFFGSFFGSLLLMALPMLLFGCISPFAIRMRTENIRSSGETAGNIYALSTVGSIVGSFLPVLVLIPIFGTRATFLSMGGALMVLALVGLMVMRGGTRVALVADLNADQRDDVFGPDPGGQFANRDRAKLSGRAGKRIGRHSLNHRSALVWKNFFFASFEMARLSIACTSSGTY